MNDYACALMAVLFQMVSLQNTTFLLALLMAKCEVFFSCEIKVI